MKERFRWLLQFKEAKVSRVKSRWSLTASRQKLLRPALKGRRNHTVQPTEGQVEVANEVKIAGPIKTEELNTKREITSAACKN